MDQRERSRFALKQKALSRRGARAFAAHQVLVGISGHVGPMAAYVRITVNNDDEANLFLDTLALLLRQGVGGADRVQGVPGNWDELGSEGMA